MNYLLYICISASGFVEMELQVKKTVLDEERESFFIPVRLE